MFHEPWWLSAVSGGRCEEVVVERDGHVVGRLPFLVTQRGPFAISRMPPFTHLLGPTVEAGSGKPQTQLTQRLSITRSLIDQLPPLAHFEQHLDPTVDGGRALADGLAFQDRGFTVNVQYTFEIDCRQSIDDLWLAMHLKTRNPIRRAEERYSVRSVCDPQLFIDFYLKNIEALGRTNRTEFEYFPALYTACESHKCGEILAAFGPDGLPLSMVYVVYSDTKMYYLLTTRGPDPSDHGSVNLLLWSGIKLAHERGLIFDLDGVYTSGTARFLSRFGGEIKTRLLVRRSRTLFKLAQSLKLRYSNNKTQYFT